MFRRQFIEAKRMRTFAAYSCLVLLGALSAQAWGPHPQITQAALDTLGTNHPLVRRLGEQFQRLTNNCWLADYKRIPWRDGGEIVYADDYLIFPDAPTHWDHICPEVKKTYRPYFKRALQALRTENAANAARWIGSLLHFIEDTGSPPHAAEIRGDVHNKMETWVDAARITIAGYRPRLLGTNDEDAVEGLRRRMDELIEFSKERGQKLRLHVELGNRTAVRPVVLESALETSRVTADVLHTLGHLPPAPTNAPTTLHGIVSTRAPAGLEKFPAKIVVEGTNVSTLADLAGRFEIRNLPAGAYRVTAFRPGSVSTNASVTLRAGATNVLRLVLASGPENLVRNGDFKLHWVRPGAPDCWTKTPLGWEGEIIPLKNGQRYRIDAKFKAEAKGDLLVRWTRHLPHEIPKAGALPKIEAQPLTPENSSLTFTGTENMALIQLTLRTPQTPGSVCESISLAPLAE